MLIKLLLTYLSFNIAAGLRWTDSGFPNSKVSKDIYLSKTGKGGANMDIYSGEAITVMIDMLSYSESLTVYCFVAAYNAQSDIEYLFCKDTDCAVTVKDGEMNDNINKYNMIFKVETRFKDKKGVKIEFTLPKPDKDASGNFYCKAKDRTANIIIQSNRIQIRDIEYWKHHLVQNTDDKKSDNTPDVRREGLPRTFQCNPGGLTMNKLKPDWINQEFQRPISWSICPVKKGYDSLKAGEKATFSNCEKYTLARWQESDETLKPINMKNMIQWTYYVDDKGDLNLFDIKLQSNPPSMTYALLCYREKSWPGSAIIPINIYFKNSTNDDIINGVEFIATTVNYDRPLRAISKPVQYVNIYARKFVETNSRHTVSIFVHYEASSSATFQWFYNGEILNSETQRSTRKYQVLFPKDITSDMAGNYSLIVTSGADKLMLTVIVSVLGPPKLKDPQCMPLIRYVWEFDSTSFHCTYQDRPENMELQINGENIMFDKFLSVTPPSLIKSFPYLNEFNFTIKKTNRSRDEASLTYSVYNMQRTLGQTKYQDHAVMFFVQNKYGLSVKSTSIYTVPKLNDKILISPESKNCTVSCSSTERHDFQCKIDITPYQNKELIIDYYWSIKGHRLEQVGNPDNKFAPYFKVDPKTKDLVLLPIESNDTERDKFVKDSLKSNNIECHFDLVSTTDLNPKFTYFSTNDASLGSKLKARITLDYQPLNTAFVYWIVAVILALLILIILIVLLTRYCMRNKGETYLLDKLERKHGYDPEKEVQEELFKPYEREEHDTEFMSDRTPDRKLSISGHSVGSADDGELDAYDLDPSNFNEDGSIIGKYGANPRSREQR